MLDRSSGFSAVKTVSLRLNLHVYCSVLACVWAAMAGVQAVSPRGATTRCFPTSKDGWDKQKDDWEDGGHGAAQVGRGGGGGDSPWVVQKLCHVKQVAQNKAVNHFLSCPPPLVTLKHGGPTQESHHQNAVCLTLFSNLILLYCIYVFSNYKSTLKAKKD